MSLQRETIIVAEVRRLQLRHQLEAIDRMLDFQEAASKDFAQSEAKRQAQQRMTYARVKQRLLSRPGQR